MFENRALSFTLNLLAEIHYLQFLCLSLCVGDKGVISSKKQRKGSKTSCVFLLNTALLGFQLVHVKFCFYTSVIWSEGVSVTLWISFSVQLCSHTCFHSYLHTIQSVRARTRFWGRENEIYSDAWAGSLAKISSYFPGLSLWHCHCAMYV